MILNNSYLVYKKQFKTTDNKANKPIYLKALPRIQIPSEKPALTGLMPYSGLV